MRLRVHHFFDIIRDIGKEVEFTPHRYGHSYHIIAGKIINDPDLSIEIVKEYDDVCDA